MKLKFEMNVDIEPSDEDLPAVEWTVDFTFDDEDQEILFTSAHTRLGGDLDFVEFLKETGNEANGDFVNSLHKLAEAHVEGHIVDAYKDLLWE